MSLRILVPVDFSDLSKKAAVYGVGLAGKLSAEITLIHVHQPPVSRNNPVYGLGAEMEDDIRKKTGIQMGEYYKDILNEPFTSCTGITKVGRPADEIALEAARNESSLILMGTRRNGGLQQWITGSRTAEVIEKTNHPVLVISSDGPTKVPEKITFLTGCDGYDLIALQKLVRVARALEATVFLVHVSTADKNGDQQVFKDFSDRIKMQTGYEKIYSQVIKNHDVIHGLSSYLEVHHPDLLSFNVRKNVMKKRLLQKTFSEKISRIADLPLLIFHRP